MLGWVLWKLISMLMCYFANQMESHCSGFPEILGEKIGQLLGCWAMGVGYVSNSIFSLGNGDWGLINCQSSMGLKTGYLVPYRFAVIDFFPVCGLGASSPCPIQDFHKGWTFLVSWMLSLKKCIVAFLKVVLGKASPSFFHSGFLSL